MTIIQPNASDQRCPLTYTQTPIKIHAKWILAGEHAVVRGGPALVFPLKSFKPFFFISNIALEFL